MPVPKHIPRWVAWLVLIAFAVSGILCTRSLIGA
jgi:hypothetical protein